MGAAQENDGYTLHVNGSNEMFSFDWYKGYLDLTFKMVKIDNTDYGNGDQVTVINGSQSPITKLAITIHGTNISMTNYINQCIAIKNLLHYTPQYEDSIAQDQFFYLDKNTGVAET